MVKNEEITGKCEVFSCCERFFAEFRRYGVIFRKIFTLNDDGLDGFNHFGCHAPIPGIGVGWQLSKYWEQMLMIDCWKAVSEVVRRPKIYKTAAKIGLENEEQITGICEQ